MNPALQPASSCQKPSTPRKAPRNLVRSPLQVGSRREKLERGQKSALSFKILPALARHSRAHKGLLLPCLVDGRAIPHPSSLTLAESRAYSPASARAAVLLRVLQHRIEYEVFHESSHFYPRVPPPPKGRIKLAFGRGAPDTKMQTPSSCNRSTTTPTPACQPNRQRLSTNPLHLTACMYAWSSHIA